MNFDFHIIAFPGSAQDAVSFLNKQSPSLDVVTIAPGWLTTVIIIHRLPRREVPDFFPNGPGYPNGVVYP